MAVTLTATPLPGEAAARLRVAASVAPSVISWDLAGLTQDQVRETFIDHATALGGATLYATGGLGYAYLPSGLAAGAGLSFPLTGLTVGQRYMLALGYLNLPGAATVDVVGMPESVALTNFAPVGSARTVPLTRAYLSFVATATTHTLRLRSAEAYPFNAVLRVTALDVRPVAADPRVLNVPTVDAAELALWTVSTSFTMVPTKQTNAGSGNTVGSAFWSNTSGASVLLGSQAYARRTVTGLVVGRVYTVTVAVNWSIPTTPPLARTLGVVGIGETAASTDSWLAYTFEATATSHVVEIGAGGTYAVPAGSYAGLSWSALRVEDVTESTAYSLVSLTRSDVNGAAAVRLREAQRLASDGQLLVVDYEAALSGVVTWSVIVYNAVSGNSYGAAATLEDLAAGDDRPVLAPASMPQFHHRPRLIDRERYTATRRSLGTVHEVVGRPDPLVTLGGFRMREDTFEALVDTYLSARELQAVYERGEVVLLRDPGLPGVDMYHVARAVRVQPAGTRWVVAIDYTEVARPTTPLLGDRGWTYDAVQLAHGTYSVVAATYATYNDLTVGPA